MDDKKRICMIVQQRDVKGGIAAVTNGYYGSELEDRYDIRYVESYCDGSKIKKLIKALKGYAEYSKALRDFKPQAVHIHSSFGPSFYRMQPFLKLALKNDIPVIDHCHGADFDGFYTNASDSKKQSIKKVFGRFAKVIVLSDEWKQRMSQILPAEKLEVVANYCKPYDREKTISLSEKRFSNKRILFLGEIGERKGGTDFAKIVASVLDKDPEAEFIFCGEGRPGFEEKVKQNIQELIPGISIRTDIGEHLPGTVSFPGWVRDERKAAIIDSSTIFILPSYNEGMPMSILDAMAAGLPIVSTNVGGIPKLVEDGRNGYLYRPGDTDEMSKAIAGLLKDKELFDQLSLESLEIASKKYGFDTHIKRLGEIYDSVIKI